MNFSKQDNWEDFDRYDKLNIKWSKCKEGKFAFKTFVASSSWMLRMNDFPDEPLFTLFIDGKEILHFNNWPSAWAKPT
jgi:hypothetical protein